ncbi:hypothetical protein TSMEX_010409 [Taenia solium]|eukprot:TsM_000354000 transcript=TsM_000354000 gene=TsM_000354000
MAVVCPVCFRQFKYHRLLRAHFEEAHAGQPTYLNERSTLLSYFFSLSVESQQLEFRLLSYIPSFSPATAILKFGAAKERYFMPEPVWTNL